MRAINRMLILFSWTALLVILPCLEQSRSMQKVTADGQDPFRGRVTFLDETPFVTRAVLRNGMTVLVNEHKMHPVVSIQIFVSAGIVDEPPDSPGIAALLAALVNRFEPDKAGGNLRNNARILGALIENETDYGHTRFEINAPASQWKKALQAQFNSLMGASFDQETIEAEKILIIEEANENIDDVSVFAQESLMELGFGSSKIGKWNSLLKSDLGLVSREKLAVFHKRMYVPERMVLVVSGDIRAGEVLNEAVRLYGDLKAAGNAGSGSIKASQGDFNYRAIRGEIPLPHLLFGFHAPEVNSRDYPAFEVLHAILGLGNGSVLSAGLRDRKRVILDGKTELSTGPGFAYLTIKVKTMPQDIDRSEIAVLTELELIKRKAPTATDMERAWSQLERDYRKQIETVSGRARSLAKFESRGDWKRIDRYISELRSVRPEDVRRAAVKYLRLENCSLVEYLPSKEEIGNRTGDSVRNTLEALLVPAADQEESLRERETVLAIEMPQDKSEFKFSQIQYPFKIASVLRGPEIYIREDHTAPLIYTGMFFPGGRLSETEDNAGITNLLVRMMLQGSEKKSVDRFHRQLEIYGGQLSPVVADDYFGFYFSIVSKNFGEGFKLLMEAVETPALDPDVLERQKMLMTVEALQPVSWRNRVENSINSGLFGDFPYSRADLGSEKSVRNINLESLNAWYDRYVKNRKPVVVIVGDTEGTSLANYFVRHFSGSRFQETEIPDRYANPLEKTETIETTWDKSRSLVSLGFQAPPVGDVDRPAVEVLQSYFGHMGRLYYEIRENMGISRQVSVFYEPRLRGGSFLAYADTSPGDEEDVLKVFEREFRRIVDSPIAYLDYRSAVNTAVGSFLIRRQSPLFEIMDVAKNALAGGEIEEYRSYQTKLQSVYDEDLKDAAERIFKMERAVLLRIHGRGPSTGNDAKAD